MKLTVLQKLSAMFILAWVLGDVTQIPRYERLIWSFIVVLIAAYDQNVHKIIWKKIISRKLKKPH